jgi:hypothetical protein
MGAAVSCFPLKRGMRVGWLENGDGGADETTAAESNTKSSR